MGYTPDEVWDMTAREFYFAMKGHYDREKFVQQQAWERVRWTTWHLLNIQLSTANKLQLTDLMEFEWEREEKRKKSKEIKPITKEELERIAKLYE